MFPRSKQWLLLTIPFIPGKHTRPKTASRSPSWVVTIQHGCLWESLYWQLRVSINGGTTKSSIYRWIFQEINHPFGDTSIYIIYENPQLTPMRRFCMSMLYCLHGVLSRLPHTILQLLDLPCLLGMYSHVVLLVKNMLLGFVRHVFTCCIDKYQYMLLGNLIIDYLAWFVSAPPCFLMLQYQ